MWTGERRRTDTDLVRGDEVDSVRGRVGQAREAHLAHVAQADLARGRAVALRGGAREAGLMM